MNAERMGGVGAVLSEELDRVRRLAPEATSVVLVEGASDRAAIESLAMRRGRHLEAGGVLVVPIAGATNIGRFLDLLGPGGLDATLAGLCDDGEAAEFGLALAAAGLIEGTGIADLETAGFFVCRADLEDELIRALGAEATLQVMKEQRQLRSFRRFQSQPAQRGKTVEAQLWRWLGNHKIRYAPLLVAALDPGQVPPPLQRLLDHV